MMMAHLNGILDRLSNNLSVEITAFSADSTHLQPLIDLGRTYYPVGHPVLTEEFLRWFYLGNPAGPATLVVALEGELWIGVIALIPVMLECPGDRTQKACYAVNVLTHPAHRGKNLFVKMISHARELLASRGIWLLGHPNSNATPGWVRQKMAFREPLQLHVAKFRMPFSSVSEASIRGLSQLQAIPADFWNTVGGASDVHLKYTPEFIAWRFIDAPHRTYSVAAVEKHGRLLGLRVTRRYKGPVDLMIDFIGPSATLSSLIASVRRPTLVMHAGLGCTGPEVNRGSWTVPAKRQIPFFVTTWNQASDDDMTGITLAASDF